MQAAELDRYGMILFSPGPIPERIRAEILDGLGGVIRDGVELVIPEGVHAWPAGTTAPDALLCVSHSDRDHYEVVRYRGEAGPRGLDVVGKTYGVMGSESAWDTFLESLRALNAIADRAGGVEPPDSPEAGEGS